MFLKIGMFECLDLPKCFCAERNHFLVAHCFIVASSTLGLSKPRKRKVHVGVPFGVSYGLLFRKDCVSTSTLLPSTPLPPCPNSRHSLSHCSTFSRLQVSSFRSDPLKLALLDVSTLGVSSFGGSTFGSCPQNPTHTQRSSTLPHLALTLFYALALTWAFSDVSSECPMFNRSIGVPHAQAVQCLSSLHVCS